MDGVASLSNPAHFSGQETGEDLDYAIHDPNRTLLILMKRSLIVIAALWVITGFCRAEDNLRTALKDVHTPKEALPLVEAYLRDHPRAADADQAAGLLGRLFAMTGNDGKALEVSEKAYASMQKGKDGDLRQALDLTHTLVNSQLATGDKKKAEAAINRLKDDFKDHAEMIQAASSMARLVDQLGMPVKGDVMELSFTDLEGRKVDLAALKGKVVLVDFWATWCGPCVGELPNVLKAYATYHDKGFEIIGISLDQEKDALASFVKENKMTWSQYFDSKGGENALANKFSIHTIPATFLIGKDGKVAATNLRGEALEEKLAELLK